MGSQEHTEPLLKEPLLTNLIKTRLNMLFLPMLPIKAEFTAMLRILGMLSNAIKNTEKCWKRWSVMVSAEKMCNAGNADPLMINIEMVCNAKQ